MIPRIKVGLYKPEMWNEIIEIARTVSNPPFSGHNWISEEALNRYYQSQLENDLYDSQVQKYVAEERGNVNGLICFKKLPWDTQQLGISVGKITNLMSRDLNGEQTSVVNKLVHVCLDQAKGLGIEYVNVRVHSSDLEILHVLENQGFITLDGILTYAKELSPEKSNSLNRNFQVRQASISDADKVAKIASDSFTYDRFHSDPVISKQKADSLHASWIVNSCLRNAADAVFLAEDTDGLIGFISCKVHRETENFFGRVFGTIVLVATAKNARSRGVASSMTQFALSWFQKQGIDFVEVGTQTSNIPASRLYMGLGFRLVRSSISLRRLISNENSL